MTKGLAKVEEWQSEDLRERVLKVVDEKKMTMEKISNMFKIDEKLYICGERGI